MTLRQAQDKARRKTDASEREQPQPAQPTLPPDGGSWVLLPDGRLVREDEAATLRQAQGEAANNDEGEPA